jgi:uncharacterized protein YutE (UPF0331/DUF86 family)
MSPIEVSVVRRKLAHIVDALSRLKSIAKLGFQEYAGDADRRDAAERRLQTSIEAAIDINIHLLVAAGHPPSADAYQSFLDLAERLRVIPHDLAERLAPSADLRNRLVRRYDDIQDELVLEAIHQALMLFPAYVEAVEAYLQRQDAAP